MASPTLAGDGPQEDSIACVPVLFVAITRRNAASLDQETRVGEQMVKQTSPLSQHLRGSGTAVESRKQSRLGARGAGAGLGSVAWGRAARPTPKPTHRALLLLVTNAKLMKKRCNDTFTEQETITTYNVPVFLYL